MSTQDEIIQVENVVKDFRPGFGLRRKRVLKGISFGVTAGEIFGFVGPNGAGKTTILKVLMGLIRATSGTATILGHDVSETEYRRKVGFLPEAAYFYDYLTGRELLNFYARLSGVSGAGRAERVATLLEWVGLTQAGDERVRNYSKGMAQRIGIAQALVHDPSVVFLDEPMSGLDPLGRKEIRDLILRLRHEGKTVFMNTHILSDVEMVCDRVAIIVEGEIRYEGRIEELPAVGDRSTEIVVASLGSAAASALEECCGADLRALGDRTEVRIDEKLIDEALRHVQQGGGSVISVTPHRHSLEDVFIDAVKEES